MGIVYPTRMFSKPKVAQTIVTEWIKIDNPSTLPMGNGLGCSLCEFNSTLYLAVAHAGSPYVTTYRGII